MNPEHPVFIQGSVGRAVAFTGIVSWAHAEQAFERSDPKVRWYVQDAVTERVIRDDRSR